MDSQEKDTVSIHFVRAAVRTLKPAARLRVLGSAGINKEWLSSDPARVPVAAFATLWLAVNRELGDEFFGLDRRRMKLGSFALITRSVLHSQDLRQALERILRGFSAVLDDISGELQADGDAAVIVLRNRIRGAEARRYAEETFLVMTHGLLCWLAGAPVVLRRIEFGFARPAHAAEHELMFSSDVVYGAAATRVFLDRKLLSGKVVQNGATVQRFLRDAPLSVLLKTRNTGSWTARLRRHLRGSERWPTLDQVAADFGIATSTLRRRLQAEGAAFQSVKDDLRRDLAIHHLYETPLSVPEIAARLGFDDPSVFRRAFKKWTRTRPSAYRPG